MNRLRVLPIVAVACLALTLEGEISSEKWINLGPTGGSFKSFLFDPHNPKTLWISDGGWYRSSNYAHSWTELDVVGTVRLDPFHPSVSIAFNGIQISRSSDGGNHYADWSEYPGGIVFSDIQYDPKKPKVLYASRIFSELFYFSTSRDGGRTWTQKQFPMSSASQQIGPLLLHPDHSDILYTLIKDFQDQNAVFKTTDGGTTWKRMNSGLSCCSKATQVLAIDPKHPEILYAGGPNGIFKTTNGGSNWTSTRCNCRVESISIDPFNPSRVYAVGSDFYADKQQLPSAVVSHDGGQSWTNLSIPRSDAWSYHEIASHPTKRNVVFAGADFSIFRSDNAGKNWEILETRNLLGLHVQSIEWDASLEGHFYAIVGQGVLLETTNFGKTWNTVEPLSRVKVSEIHIHPLHPDVIFARLDSGVAVSRDGGKSWNSIRLRTIPAGIVLHPKKPSTLFLWSAFRKGIAKSENFGKSWTWINSEISMEWLHTVTIHPRTCNLVAVASTGSIFKGENGGKTWTRVSTAFQFETPRSLVLNSRNENIFYLTTSIGEGDTTRYVLNKTKDGGKTWTIVKEKVFTFAINSLNPKQITAVSDRLIISNNAGSTWVDLPTDGLDIGRFVTDIQIATSEPNLILINGRGILALPLN